MNDKVKMGLRVLLGVAMIVFGANKFGHFMPMPPPEGEWAVLMGSFVSSGFLKLIAVLEIVFGLLLVLGKYVPLALTIIAAIMFNAAVLHGLYDPANIAGALVFLILSLVLVYMNKDRFSDLLSA